MVICVGIWLKTDNSNYSEIMKEYAITNFLRYLKKKGGGGNDILYECYINIILMLLQEPKHWARRK